MEREVDWAGGDWVDFGWGESNDRGLLADGGHGGAEEKFEVAGGFGVLFDGGLDGFLRDGTGVAEVDQGGEGVIACGTVVWASGCDRDGYG